MSSKMDKAMESDFWYFVSEIKWGDGVKSAEVTRRNALKRVPPYKANKFREIASKLVKNIIEQVGQEHSYPNWVLTAAAYEVVGYGKTNYEQALKNPSTVVPVIESIELIDQDHLFFNVLPTEDDYYND